MPFAIIASRELMSVSRMELDAKEGNLQKTQKKMCHLNTQNRVEQKTNEKVKNAKTRLFSRLKTRYDD